MALELVRQLSAGLRQTRPHYEFRDFLDYPGEMMISINGDPLRRVTLEFTLTASDELRISPAKLWPHKIRRLDYLARKIVHLSTFLAQLHGMTSRNVVDAVS